MTELESCFQETQESEEEKPRQTENDCKVAQVSGVAQGAQAIRQSTTWSPISLYRMSGVSQATEGWPKKGLCDGHT